MSAPLGITFMAVKVVLLVKIGAGRLSLTLMMVVLVYSMQRVLLMWMVLLLMLHLRQLARSEVRIGIGHNQFCRIRR